MSYDKAMKHHANIRKCKKQSNNHFGFAVGSEWKAARSTDYGSAFMNVRDWWKERKLGLSRVKRKDLYEAIREQIALLRIMSPKFFRIFCASIAVSKRGGFMQPDGSWGEKMTAAKFDPAFRAAGLWPDNVPADAVWKVS
ncbi:MAG: hypothetical protein ACTS9Y_00285 [Methylophilus sp.]|uniref:hypothetical protein n=1 Tax=Methylophilus sp. TaxID=29541 RepID=UPI003FA0AE01